MGNSTGQGGGFRYGLKQEKDFVDHGFLSVPHSSGVAQWRDPGAPSWPGLSIIKAGIEDSRAGLGMVATDWLASRSGKQARELQSPRARGTHDEKVDAFWNRVLHLELRHVSGYSSNKQ